MATNDSLKNTMTASNKQAPAAAATFKQYMGAPNMKKKFEEVLGKRAPQFMTSMMNLVNNEKTLREAEPTSIITSCMIAATLDLPVDKNLGYAWIIAYKDRNTGVPVAQFQLGYKGYIQLALRTAQYKNINAIPIHEGELKKWDPLTEELEIDFEAKKSDAVTGYAGFFELNNGFRKTVYWSRDKVAAHELKFRKGRDMGKMWRDDFDAMAIKTVIRNLLSKWGILSIEMQNAYSAEIASETGGRIEVNTSEEGEAVFDITPGDVSDFEEVLSAS